MNYPGSNLHQLSGDKKGLYAVKVFENWRITFEFIEGDINSLLTLRSVILPMVVREGITVKCVRSLTKL